MTLLLIIKGLALESANWHVRSRMTQPQQVMETRFEEETLEGSECDSSGSGRKSPGGERWGIDHPVDIRLSIPFLFARCYVTIVAGKERRSRERQASERQKHPVLKYGNLVFAAGCGLVIGLAMLSLFQLATAHVLQQLGVMVLP